MGDYVEGPPNTCNAYGVAEQRTFFYLLVKTLRFSFLLRWQLIFCCGLKSSNVLTHHCYPLLFTDIRSQLCSWYISSFFKVTVVRQDGVEKRPGCGSRYGHLLPGKWKQVSEPPGSQFLHVQKWRFTSEFYFVRNKWGNVCKRRW